MMMKMTRACLLLTLAATGANAFAPPRPASTTKIATLRSLGSSSSARSALHMVDPTFLLQDVQNHLHDAVTTISSASSSFMLADVDTMVDAAMNTVPSEAGDAMVDAAKDDGGWFGFLTVPIKGLLMAIHGLLVSVGMQADSWGLSIIALTILIKVLTYPLTKTQLESTNRMQAFQPAIREIQTKYASNPEVMNQKMAEFYQQNNINPLAGCLPTLVQIPVFIGLYRAVLDLAKEDRLNDSFLWLPSLEGPTYGADPASGSDWILQGWQDGVPSLGWADTTAFLILPVLLVVSQFASMKLMQPDTDDPVIKEQQNNIILKILPFMIGWFSLNVPAALCLYWMTNNIITTATSLFIKSTMKIEPVGVSSGTATAPPPEPSIFAPPRERPSGFGSSTTSSSSTTTTSSSSSAMSSDGIKPLTPVDAEIIDDDDDDGDDDDDSEKSSDSGKKKRGPKKRKKRKN